MSSIYIEKLKKAMPPLDPPPDNVVDWAMVRDVYGLDFPNDFKDFITTYGNVIWCDLFRAIYPETGTRQECEASRTDVLETLSLIGGDRLYDVDGNVVEVPCYPTPGGLLPCLTDTNSDFILWRTEGEPDDWTVVKYSCGNVFMFDFGLTQLICDWIERVPPADQVWGAVFLGPAKSVIAR
jgi:hypothetical protein